MLLARVPPREACKPPAPKGRKVSELEKKKRALTLSRPLRKSRSQFVVNWSSLYLPGLLTSSCPVEPGVPATEGMKYPFGSLNWLLLNCKSFNTTGSMATWGLPVKKAEEIDCAERSVGMTGKPGLLICVPGERALRCRVPW